MSETLHVYSHSRRIRRSDTARQNSNVRSEAARTFWIGTPSVAAISTMFLCDVLLLVGQVKLNIRSNVSQAVLTLGTLFRFWFIYVERPQSARSFLKNLLQIEDTTLKYERAQLMWSLSSAKMLLSQRFRWSHNKPVNGVLRGTFRFQPCSYRGIWSRSLFGSTVPSRSAYMTLISVCARSWEGSDRSVWPVWTA